MKTTTIHRSAFATSQHRDYAHILRVTGSTDVTRSATLRVTIHRDTSYQNQSSAKIECWTGGSWSALHHLHGSEVTTTPGKLVTSGCEAVSPAEFAAVEKTLLAIANAILVIDAPR